MSLFVFRLKCLATENNTTGRSCEKWEEYNGVQCVCARSSGNHSRCDGETGMVCDGQGEQYQSICHFSLSMCQGLLSYTKEMKTCGHCKWLMVTYSEPQVPSQAVLYRRNGESKGYDTYYNSLEDNSKIFYEKELNAWVIGIKNETGSFVSLVQEEKVLFPQDNAGGMLVVNKTEGSTVDLQINPYFQIKCLKDSDIGKIRKREKRFIFTLIAVISAVVSVTAVATSTTLKIIQAKRGCLYYPSVCRLRDEIKNTLKPEVETLKRSFLIKYGDPEKIKGYVEKHIDLISDINEAVTTIKELHIKSNSSLSELTTRLGSLTMDVSGVANLLSEYNEWLNGTKLQAVFSIIGFEIELVITVATLPSIISSAASALTAGIAIFTSVIAIGFAIADIVSSVQEERRIKNKLLSAKSEYLRARRNLKTAHSRMIKLQKQFCEKVINYLRQFSKTGKKYHKLFSDLYDKIVSLYGKWGNCADERIYSKTNMYVLSMLVNYVKPLVKYLSDNVKQLKEKIREVKIMTQFLKEIADSVKVRKKQPSRIFEELEVYGSYTSIPKPVFSNLFDLLRYIAKDILPKTDCYWGHDLKLIRSGKRRQYNYLNSPVCPSSEIQETIKIIESGVKNITNPCLIYRHVKGNIFRSKYLVLRYIAEHIIPTSNCYWGYNLQTIRLNPNPIELEMVKISSTLFTMLKVFSIVKITEATVQRARAYMCSKSLICGENWQPFILCSVWKDSVDPNVLDCRGKSSSVNDKYCVPPQGRFQECK
ncbi:uncharacterized protein LOC133184482 [Saccostrea echinata]|uniref:uncharacterized protein LOC133184482 n=1 Tax=Saccostrea echinata TaxID=191078 RepID=UPI002A829DD2|nr:uncharacterized protein LOC133184482 [Saccostrea echinata]